MSLEQIPSAIQTLFGGQSPQGATPSTGVPGPAPTSPLTPTFMPGTQPQLGTPGAVPPPKTANSVFQPRSAVAPSITPPGLQTLQTPPQPLSPAAPKVDALGRRIIDDSNKAPADAAVKRDSLSRDIKQSVDASLEKLSDPSLREQFGDVMGKNWYGLGGGQSLRTNWRNSNKEDTPINSAESFVRGHITRNQWLTTVGITGAAMNGTELKFANGMTPSLNEEQSAIVDQPWEVVQKLIGQRIFLSVADYKNKVYDRTKGSAGEKQAAADSVGDFTKAMAARQELLMNKWRQKKKLEASDFDIENIAPQLVDDDASRLFQQYKNSRQQKAK